MDSGRGKGIFCVSDIQTASGSHLIFYSVGVQGHFSGE